MAVSVYLGDRAFYTEQMDAEGLGRKLLLTPAVTPAEPLKSRPWVLGQHLTNAKPASSLELSQCWHCKEGLPGPRRGFRVPFGSLSPKKAASICTFLRLFELAPAQSLAVSVYLQDGAF